jgi:tol-pal system protein YbgF
MGFRADKTHFLLGILFLFALLISGCASRKEVVQFQADHNEFRGQLESIDGRVSSIEEHLETLDPKLNEIERKIGELHSLLGGNVSDYLHLQEDLLRSLKADQTAVTSELERLILALSSRVDQSDGRVQEFMLQVDTFNQLIVKVLGDSLAADGRDIIESQKLFQQSYSDFIQGEFEVARMGFQEYVKSYPATTMSDDALYWVGESYLAEALPDSAGMIFAQLEDRYPVSNRLPIILLKRAVMRLDVGNKVGARRLLERIINEYPDSDVSDQANIRMIDTQEDAGEATPEVEPEG